MKVCRSEMLLRIIRFWWLWISRKVKSDRFIKIISTRWCSVTWIWTILSFTCCLQGWNLFTRWIFNKRTYQERVWVILYDLDSSNLTSFDPKTEMFTVCQIQNVSAGRKYSQCSEQEASFKRSFFKVRIYLTLVDLMWPIGIFQIESGPVLVRMKPCSFVTVNLMPLKMVGDLSLTWWKVDLITVRLWRFMECIYLVQKLENELMGHQEREKTGLHRQVVSLPATKPIL